jgi:hypothetical protein
MAEMVARRGRTIGELLKDLFSKYGSFYPVRENFRLTDEVKRKFTEKVKKDPRELAGEKVKQVVRTDGLKLIFDDGSSPAPSLWFAFIPKRVIRRRAPRSQTQGRIGSCSRRREVE